MTPSVIALVLFAAILHATWNALLRSGADRLWSITMMSFATTAAAAVCAALLPLPARASWPYLAASAALQVGYSVFLAYAYQGAALSQVYPVVRGTVPLLVTLGGYAWAGQRLGGASLAGVALVSGGIASLTLGRSRIHLRSFAAALVTALFIGGYVTVDGVGSRIAGDPLAYAAWIFIAYGIAMPAVFFLFGRRLSGGFTRGEMLKSAAGGLISLISYAAVVDALSRGPVGPIAALRETSIVFSVLIGWAWLGEKPSGRRFAACAAVAVGAACLTYPV
ncbi:DMT family transporter [Burkholderia oklahomensis]|uniref:DMT family transporter n=1 Tax=Burkholderia oklahomensis TaxID=342113 RepID=UPI00016A7FD4|nr:DMT family transporter [Burkholderia oklahomensis]AJX36022.1 eamA-like transporter family protein [Burkholderia oklahomensis C6786]AOI48990.1 multidrug DMT transporter permease [Burkholderia oklahomensis C6786]KUY61106.1 multidrug DMT transporter permease [Burkholderia oklahomensis C6786]MBI0362790.1 EamA family transporter [Burkholderia oklahomensis]SUY26897.1 phosphonate utilization associated putative membrane protein [Burkholderia oklahomensis]